MAARSPPSNRGRPRPRRAAQCHRESTGRPPRDPRLSKRVVGNCLCTRGSQRVVGNCLRARGSQRVARMPHESPEVPASRRELPLHLRPQRVAGMPHESPEVPASRRDAPRVARGPSESSGCPASCPRSQRVGGNCLRARGPGRQPRHETPCSRRSCAAFNLGHISMASNGAASTTGNTPVKLCHDGRIVQWCQALCGTRCGCNAQRLLLTTASD